MEALLRIGRGQDRTREFSMPGINNQVQIALLGPRGHARGRSGTLGHDTNQRCLGHASQTDALVHERKPAAGSVDQGPRTGKRCPQSHVHGSNLVLDLFVHKAEGSALLDQGHGDSGGRGHGIKRNKIASGSQCSQGDGLVAVDHHPFGRILRGWCDAGKIEFLCLHPIKGSTYHLHVGLHNRLALFAERFGQKIFENGHIVANGGPKNAKGHGVVKQRLGRKLIKGNSQCVEIAGIDVVTSQYDASLSQPGTVLFKGFRIERHQNIDGLGRTAQLLRPHADGKGVVPATYPRHVFLGHQQVIPGPDNSLGHETTDSRQSLPGGPAYNDVDTGFRHEEPRLR